MQQSSLSIVSVLSPPSGRAICMIWPWLTGICHGSALGWPPLTRAAVPDVGGSTLLQPGLGPVLDLSWGSCYTPLHSVGEQPLDQGQVPMAYQDAVCGRLIPRHNPLSPHSGKGH